MSNWIQFNEIEQGQVISYESFHLIKVESFELEWVHLSDEEVIWGTFNVVGFPG